MARGVALFRGPEPQVGRKYCPGREGPGEGALWTARQRRRPLPSLSFGFSSPGSRHRPLSRVTNSSPGPGNSTYPRPARRGWRRTEASRRHPRRSRCGLPETGSCSGMGDPRLQLPRWLRSGRVLLLPPPHLPESRLTRQLQSTLRPRAPPPILSQGRGPASHRHPLSVPVPTARREEEAALVPGCPGVQAFSAGTFPSLGPRQATE